MEQVGQLLLFVGLIVGVIPHIEVGIFGFKRNFIEGLSCILVPGYLIYFTLRQETRQLKVLALWSGGIIISITGVGVILLS